MLVQPLGMLTNGEILSKQAGTISIYPWTEIERISVRTVWTYIRYIIYLKYFSTALFIYDIIIIVEGISRNW